MVHACIQATLHSWSQAWSISTSTKAVKMVGEQERGRNFNLNSLQCFGRVSDHILTVMPSSRKAVPLCFRISKLLATFHWALFTRQVFSLYSLFLFYPSQIAAALCAEGVRPWCESWMQRKAAEAQPSGPLVALHNCCHQGERIRFSKMVSTGQTLPFYSTVNL